MKSEGLEGQVTRRIALFTASSMILALLSFLLTAIDSSILIELNPFSTVGALRTLLLAELALLVCGLLVAKAVRGNPNIRLLLSGLVMALMTGDAANDILRTLVPGQNYLAVVAPVMIPAGVMALVAIDIEESREHASVQLA